MIPPIIYDRYPPPKHDTNVSSSPSLLTELINFIIDQATTYR